MKFHPKFKVKKWTPSSAFCYSIRCNCSKCYLAEILETKCKMKAVVFELIRKFGIPDIEKIENEYPKGFTKY